MSKLKDWKIVNMPQDGVCPECKMQRGFDLKQWTLLPNHMYCKYCFIRNVGDKAEQQRIRDLFTSAFRATGVVTAKAFETAMLEGVQELLESVRMLLPQQYAVLTQQFIGMADESAKEHIRRRLLIRSAPDTLGRYLIGPELEAKYGERLGELIERAPLSLLRGMQAVATTPGIMVLHNGDELPWMAKSMRNFTTVREDYPMYPCAYVQALAKGI